MALSLTFEVMNRRWPRAPHSLVEGIVAQSADAFAKYGIETCNELADFMAQISEECSAGTELEENLNYSASRLHAVWPSRFPSVALAAPYAHNPRALADRVYNGRMGNAVGSDDGWLYRGRGAIQITGKQNYFMLGTIAALPFGQYPDLIIDPKYFLIAGVAYWKHLGLNKLADAGRFRDETIRINGGLNGMSERAAWRAVWRKELC